MTVKADRAVLVDTNVLLTATDPTRPLHAQAMEVMGEWPNKGQALMTSGQILREYLVVATRPHAQNGLGLEPEVALRNVSRMTERMRCLAEGAKVAERLQELIRKFGVQGKKIRDANLVALASVHRVAKLVTANIDDFRRFEASMEILDLADVS